MNSSSPMPSDRATAESDQVAESSTVYRKYVAGSAAAYQRYLRPVATRAADAYQSGEAARGAGGWSVDG
jgi:hypothetical protein